MVAALRAHLARVTRHEADIVAAETAVYQLLHDALRPFAFVVYTNYGPSHLDSSYQRTRTTRVP